MLRVAESVCDDVWQRVVGWSPFERDTVGAQLVRAADSIGANIAESFGRFNYGEKLQFLYYARGSLFETKYWLNRASIRQLMPPDQVQACLSQLTDLARQLNAFASSVRQQRQGKSMARTIGEQPQSYAATDALLVPATLLSDSDINLLETPESPISNL
jgi:four helix bundle protein